LERYAIQPQLQHPCRRWVASDAGYLGTTIACGTVFDPSAAERLHGGLKNIADLTAAADAVDDRLLIVRLASRSGPPFHEARLWTKAAFDGGKGVAMGP
jgi:hypothetical protein